MKPVNIPEKSELIGALGVSFAAPMQDGSPGTLGLVSFKLSYGQYLSKGEILLWIRDELCKHLTPFPGPNSIVVFDNMSQHRQFETTIRGWINERGAILLWQSPHSADLNLIENMWKVISDRIQKKRLENSVEKGEPQYSLSTGDLLTCFKFACMSTKAFFKLATACTCEACAGEKDQDN